MLDQDAVASKDAAIQAHVSQREKAFMRSPWLRSMGGTWATFLRLPGETCLEAFQRERTNRSRLAIRSSSTAQVLGVVFFCAGVWE